MQARGSPSHRERGPGPPDCSRRDPRGPRRGGCVRRRGHPPTPPRGPDRVAIPRGSGSAPISRSTLLSPSSRATSSAANGSTAPRSSAPGWAFRAAGFRAGGAEGPEPCWTFPNCHRQETSSASRGVSGSCVRLVGALPPRPSGWWVAIGSSRVVGSHEATAVVAVGSSGSVRHRPAPTGPRGRTGGAGRAR